MKRIIQMLAATVLSVALNGCLMSHSFHNQVIDSTRSEIQITAWLSGRRDNVVFSCWKSIDGTERYGADYEIAWLGDWQDRAD